MDSLSLCYSPLYSQSLNINFLGTGTSGGVPMLACPCDVCKSLDPKDKRLRSSLLVRTGTKNILIDCGPDFRQQMLAMQVQRIDAILITHEHRDHTAGLDDIRAYNFFQNEPLKIYCSAAVEASIRDQFAYAFTSKPIKGLPEMEFINIDIDRTFNLFDIPITPISVMHHLLPVLGFRMGDFTYITDANHITAKELAKVQGSKYFVLNALRKEKHISHYTLAEAIAIAQKIAAPTTYFTHLSHQMGTHIETEKLLPPSMHIAYDGLEITVD